jgi:hypothetical protein
MPEDEGAEEKTWFAGRRSLILLYRVNRRARPQGNFFAEQPGDPFVHFVEVLPLGEEVTTGRRDKHTWIVGGENIDEARRVLSGQIGWYRRATKALDTFDSESLSWTVGVGASEASAVAPFAYDGESRILAVVQHPSFDDRTLSYVFETLLTLGENRRPAATTDWSVEPILDKGDFLTWLRRTDVVEEVVFVAKLPNPDAMESFREVFDRLERLRAGTLREELRARDAEVGLQNVETDRDARQIIAMAEQGYGYVTAHGSRGGRPTSFDQRRRGERVRTNPLPASWGELVGILIDFLLQRRRNRGEQH